MLPSLRLIEVVCIVFFVTSGRVWKTLFFFGLTLYLAAVYVWPVLPPGVQQDVIAVSPAAFAATRDVAATWLRALGNTSAALHTALEETVVHAYRMYYVYWDRAQPRPAFSREVHGSPPHVYSDQAQPQPASSREARGSPPRQEPSLPWLPTPWLPNGALL